VDIGQGGSYLREDRSDGTTVFTITDTASLQAAARVGARGRIGNVGIEASAEASAGGELENALQYTVPTDDADELEDALRRQGGFGQILRNGVEGGLAGPVIIDPVNDFLFGEDEPDLPEPSAQYVGGGFIAEAGASAAAELGPVAGAELAAAIEGAGGARLITSGPDEGNVELFIQLDTSAASVSGLSTADPGGTRGVARPAGGSPALPRVVVAGGTGPAACQWRAGT